MADKIQARCAPLHFLPLSRPWTATINVLRACILYMFSLPGLDACDWNFSSSTIACLLSPRIFDEIFMRREAYLQCKRTLIFLASATSRIRRSHIQFLQKLSPPWPMSEHSEPKYYDNRLLCYSHSDFVSHANTGLSSGRRGKTHLRCQVM